MKHLLPGLFLCAVAALHAGDEPAATTRPVDPRQGEERTSFQTHAHWDPRIQLRSDVAMCYGIGPDIGERIAEWKAQGYRVHVMTGVAWGEYQDYLYGRFDGVNHEDEAQMDRNGKVISHGGDVYYMSPGENYGKFLCLGVKRALDAGAEGIHLEEPEFWARAGWSKGFQREWKSYYGEDWVSPDSSPDAQYKASKLKYYLYQRALKQVFDFVKAYNAEHGTHVKCYVPTHSLVNYALWCIVSPESSLLNVGADGYIAQVWTGTARSPNMYEGKREERTFESAFLEYGAMMNIVRASGATVWFLNDPIEDNPRHTWEDYRTNWESTLTASLLWPQVWRFEVMPWPERIFKGKYPVKEPKRGEEVEKEGIPPAYATELMTVINALNDMKQPDISWDCGTQGIGVVISDSLMFQREQPTPSDPYLGSFFGLSLPLVKRGIPVEPVQLENSTMPGALDPYKVLLLTFEGMKPMYEKDSKALADWVRGGGVLVYVDDDKDPYNKVSAWWNTAPNTFENPREAFFQQLGLDAKVAAGAHKVGKGTVIYDKSSPAALTYGADGADSIRKLVREACDAAKLEYKETDYMILRRGPYVVGAGIDGNPDGKTLKGEYVDLFDANLPVLKDVAVTPGARLLLLDLAKSGQTAPAILASACKTLDLKKTSKGIEFYAEGPEAIEAVVRLKLDSVPKEVLVDGKALPKEAVQWDEGTKTLLIRFPNSPSGHRVVLAGSV